MSDDTGIEWTHVPGYRGATWNPVRGCTKISPGCKHCYAETFAERWRGIAGHPYEQGFDLRLVPEKLDEPLRRRDPRAYFVNSMSDLFQDGVDFGFVSRVFGVMAETPRHIYMALTKRADRMREFMEWTIGEDAVPMLDTLRAMQAGRWPLPNVWLGVSVEDRKYGLPRIDILRDTPAAVRFLSVEPLLEDLGAIDLTGIHWVIVGGESGPGARPMNGAWVRSIRDQCAAQGVAFFFKQWGGVMKKNHGRILDGRTHDEFPVFAKSA
jgi:protein gp37